MKKYFFDALLTTVVITFSTFTSLNILEDYVYLTYLDSGDQADVDNYDQQVSMPATCPGAVKLYWFRALDINGNGRIDASEMNAAFDVLDTDHDGSLDDEAEIPGILEKKF